MYQEQIIRILTDIAGYTASEADNVRRAVGKKKKAALLAEREQFVSGALESSGISEEIAGEVFDHIEKFARYGFNQAHAADYAVIVCQTAYLKAKYPLEYMAALLSVERNNTDKIAVIAAETRRLGIGLLPPDVNHSECDFVIEDGGIRFGLGAIKGVGDGPVEAVVAGRKDGSPFADLDEFAKQVDLRQVNRKALECLIRVGALDCFGERNHLLSAIDAMLGVSRQTWNARDEGQLSMFDMDSSHALSGIAILDDVVEVPEPASQRERYAWERELSGTYFTEHPLQTAVGRLRDLDLTPSTLVTEDLAGTRVKMLGSVMQVRPLLTRNGKPMAFVQMEDLQGLFELVVFPKVYQRTQELWVHGKILLVRGKVDSPDQTPKLICDMATDQLTFSRSAEANGAPPPDAAGYVGVPPEDDPFLGEPPQVPAAGSRTAALGQATSGQPTVTAASQRVVVTLRRTGDLATDKQKLGLIFSVFEKYSGSDRFSIRLVAGNQWRELDFPNTTTRCCDALLQELRQAVHLESLHVEAFPSDALLRTS